MSLLRPQRFGDVPSGLTNYHREFLQKMKDAIDILIGAKRAAADATTPPRSQAVTWGDLNPNDPPTDLEIDCGNGKTIVLVQPVWDDLRITPGSFDRPGVTDPTIVAYDVNGGGVSTYLWQFQKTAIASFVVQMPHTYKIGTDIYVHIHWTAGPRGTAENGKTVGWKIDYSWANIDGLFGTMTTADLSDTCDNANHKHQMTPDVVINGHTVEKNISSMLLCNVKRTDTGTDDTWAGTTSGNLPMLLEIDFHYQIETLGSRQKGIK